MNKLIKTLSLALLLCIPVAHSMEKDAIVPVNSKRLTMGDTNLLEEILQKIFIYAGSYEATLRDSATLVGKIRSLCKYCLTFFNPIATRQMLNWDIKNVAFAMHLTKNSKNKENDYYYIKFLADTLKNKPHIYDQIMPLIVMSGQYERAKILFENGANPNHFSDKAPISLLKNSDHNMEIFQLILQHGGDIHQDSGNGQTMMDIALANATNGDNEILKVILQEKGHLHPQNQENVNAFLALEKQKNANLSIMLVGSTAIAALLVGERLYRECTLF